MGDSCQRCGRCCYHNGLIPPVVPLDGEEGAAWLIHVVERLRHRFADVAEYFPPCLFYDDAAKACTVYDERPTVCRDFQCDKTRSTAAGKGNQEC